MVDDYLFIAMREPFTTVEDTLIRSGKHDLFREYRQTFQNERPDPTSLNDPGPEGLIRHERTHDGRPPGAETGSGRARAAVVDTAAVRGNSQS